MALALMKNIDSIAPHIKTSFYGTGGTPPYTYSIEPLGAGGTIDSTSGLYTAPSEVGSGFDVIKVTDNVAATATSSIAVKTYLGLMCDIIQKEMSLTDGQVYLYNQNFEIPKDNKLYISVGILTMNPYSNNAKFIDDPSGLLQIVTSNIKASLSINMQSSGFLSLEKKEELIMALSGFYSKQIQEANNFYVGIIPSSFVNLSSDDGAVIPYHYNMTANMKYSAKKIYNVDYFDTFENVEVNTNK